MVRSNLVLALAWHRRIHRWVRKTVGSGLLAGILAASPALAQLPDLSVRLQGPGEALAGTDIGAKLKLTVINVGQGVARGTETAGINGYMVDIFLTRSALPDGFAMYSEHYRDGVLLRGGRISNTFDIQPGKRHGYGTDAGLPADVPAGVYRLCARVDPGEAVAESNEDNNLACVALKVKRLQLVPVPTLAEAGTQTAPSTSRRSVLPDGTLQLAYPDGTRRQLRPNGQVVTVYPDGHTMVPYSLQVQPAGLPPLPEDLADWGTHVSEGLLGIIRGILTEPEYQAYLQTEQDKPFYDLLEWRMDSVRFLTAEP